jgi:methylenetetrahydrofolate dehydrogenase (NADP+) / methenyltetrahydrofolate cyclohydrolase
MSATLLDGKALATSFEYLIAQKVSTLTHQGNRPPGLGVVLVGDNQASRVYVGNKERFAKRCGFLTINHTLSASVSELEILQVVDSLNNDLSVDGILVQLPLPQGLDQDRILQALRPGKDADGLHPLSQGYLVSSNCSPYSISCTPLGVMKLLNFAFESIEQRAKRAPDTESPDVDLGGLHAVVVGRSVLVGKPVASLLLGRNATVTIAHSRTPNLAEVCRTADVLVVAVGVPELIKGTWIKKGAIVIDVGINRTKEGKLVGDVKFDEARGVAKAITPVPGGVGPLTVAMLMLNTFLLYEKGLKPPQALPLS